MAQLADALNRYAYTGDSCEWCEAEIVLDRETGETECDCFDPDKDDEVTDTDD